MEAKENEEEDGGEEEANAAAVIAEGDTADAEAEPVPAAPATKV